ncbi:unnamed protein product [Effrenium voratum]|nr:unnamed protein product [Effrenium voratum]
MVSDAAWADTVEALREMRQSKEEPIQDPQDEDEDAKERDALRAAQGITADGDDAEEEATEPVAEEATEEDPAVNITERYMDESKFGCLWIVFKDGTRCTVRMHHERLWYADVSWDVSSSRPGVQVSYTPPSGVVVQAFSDASIRQSWLRPVPSGAAEDLLPGQAQDLEQARLVTAFGVLVIERLSGRREVYHPSGTRAWRNPTTEELQQRVEQFRRAAGHCDAVAQAFAKRLAQICEAWEANQAEEEEMDPSETNKYFGMPGHWRVTTREGRRFGRAERAWPELEAPEVPEVPEADVLGDESKRSSKAESRGSKPPSRPPSKNPSKDEAPPPADDEDLESEPEPPEPPPSLQDILEAVLVDEGNNIEYELDPVPMLTMLDPHTGITSISNEEGMLVLLDKESSVCVLPDGTRLTCLGETEGSQVVMEKEGAARVTCRIKDKAYVPNSMVQVEMEDGATMEVVPRRLNLKAELVPSDPQRFLAKLHGEPEDAQAAALEISQQRNSMSQHEFCINHDPREDSYSTNASVILRQPDGTMLHSKGAGEVELVSGMDLAAVGGEKALKTLQDKGCVYVAQVDYDRIFLRDDDGNYFEVQGDQSLDFKLSVSMGDDFASPRCVCPQKPFKHPDASFLPLPEEAPPPRLFVVYGDGEAEELLLPRDVEEALRLAKQDPKALVVEGERMGWPMSCCKTHSIHRIMPMDPVSVPLRPLELPPSMAGFVQPEMPQRTYTQFRQFIEYPKITEPKLKAWERAYEEYERHEEQRLLLRSSLGAGLRKASMRTSSTVSLSLADQTKLREDKTDTATEASDPREGGA